MVLPCYVEWAGGYFVEPNWRRPVSFLFLHVCINVGISHSQRYPDSIGWYNIPFSANREDMGTFYFPCLSQKTLFSFLNKQLRKKQTMIQDFGILKAMLLWVFILIQCLTLSFLSNVGLFYPMWDFLTHTWTIPNISPQG